MKTLIALFLLLATGCASLPPASITPQAESRLQQLDSWRLTGKLGYRSDQGAGSAWLDWQQHTPAFQLTLSGPFGAGTTRIEGSDNQAVLTRQGQQPIQAASPVELTTLLFGWAWPVDELLSWVKGLPSPTSKPTLISKDASGKLMDLHQSGWELAFSDYSQVETELALPGKIVGNKGAIKFTLVIKAWQLEEPDAR